MIFHLGVIGHAESLISVRKAVQNTFDSIELYPIEFNSDEDIENVILQVQKIIPLCDGLLFTGIDPYKLISTKINIDLPMRYIAFTGPHLIKSLLKSVCNGMKTIFSISIDTLSYSTVVRSYESIGIDVEKLQISIINIQSNSDHYIKKIEEEHTRNFEEGRCALCVTTITSVYNSLKEKGFPTTLITPDEETYLYEIKSIIAKDEIKKSSQNSIVTILFEFKEKDNFYISNETQMSEIMEISKLMEYIAIFSQKLNGALFHISQYQYVICCSGKDLEIETDNYKRFDLLDTIKSNTMHIASIGIGYGSTLELSKKNATIAIRKSKTENRNVAYVAYGADKLIGPISNNALNTSVPEIFEKRLVAIATNTHLSINTIYKIDCIVRQSDTKRFTSKELSEKLGVSLRTTNRILSALNDNGYITYVGKSIISQKGRPTSFIKINF